MPATSGVAVQMAADKCRSNHPRVAVIVVIVSLLQTLQTELTMATPSPYSQPPPSYGAAPKAGSSDDSRSPLLGSSSRGGGGGFYDQPEAGDLPDDFKVSNS